MSKKVLNILAVDDDESILKLVKLYLGALGHFVDSETSPIKVLDRNFRQKVDLLVVDLQMPEMGGFEFIERFREKPLMKFVPVVMLTSNSELEKIKNAATIGVVEYIVKPLDKEVGVVKLKRVIDQISASEIQLPANSKNTAAVAEFKVRLVSVGEDFVKILTGFAVPVGTKLQMKGDFFEQLDLKLGPLNVEECSPTDEGFLLFVKFSNVGKGTQESIRNWMVRFK